MTTIKDEIKAVEKEIECKHKWNKINKKLFTSKATYYCNKCGCLGKEKKK